MPISSLSTPGRLLLTTFGLGRLRPAPGTWGSMPPVVVAAGMLAMGMGTSGPSSGGWWVYHGVLMLVLVVFSLACLVYGDAAEAHFNAKDPGSICADETAGVCLPLMFLPHASVMGFWRTATTLLGVFLLFRVLDIVKPWPARRLQAWPSGLGVLVDDLVVGLQALVIVQIITRLWIV